MEKGERGGYGMGDIPKLLVLFSISSTMSHRDGKVKKHARKGMR